MSQISEQSEKWAVVEIMGHNTYVGLISEEVFAGATMLRIDVPEIPDQEGSSGVPGYSKLFGSSAIYSITLVSKELALLLVREHKKKPLDVYLPELYPPREMASSPMRRALAAGDYDPDRDERDIFENE